jgi:hypothetical protein
MQVQGSTFSPALAETPIPPVTLNADITSPNSGKTQQTIILPNGQPLNITINVSTSDKKEEEATGNSFLRIAYIGLTALAHYTAASNSYQHSLEPEGYNAYAIGIAAGLLTGGLYHRSTQFISDIFQGINKDSIEFSNSEWYVKAGIIGYKTLAYKLMAEFVAKQANLTMTCPAEVNTNETCYMNLTHAYSFVLAFEAVNRISERIIKQ